MSNYNEFENIIKEQISKLEEAKQFHSDEIKIINIKISVMNELNDSLIEKNEMIIEKQKEILTSKVQSSKIMDGKDIKRVNLFIEYKNTCKGEKLFQNVKKKLPKLEYYLYNKKARLWNNWEEFLNDFKDYDNRTGYWTNALPKADGREIDPDFPIMKMNKKK